MPVEAPKITTQESVFLYSPFEKKAKDPNVDLVLCLLI